MTISGTSGHKAVATKAAPYLTSNNTIIAPPVNISYHRDMLTVNFHDDHTLTHLHQQVAGFVSFALFGSVDGFVPSSSMAVLRGNDLIGATVYHNYQPEAGVVELSSYGADPRWLSPRVIRAMFGYPFDALGCQMVVLRVSDRNDTMNDIARRFGFISTHITRMRGRDEGEFIHTMTDDQWRAHRLYRPFPLR